MSGRAAAVFVLLTVVGAHAAGAVLPNGGGAPPFEVIVAGEPTTAAALASALEEPLARVHLAATITIELRLPDPGLLDATAAGPGPDARAVILLPAHGEGTPARIYLLDRQTHRLLARQVPIDPARPEIGCEEIAHLVASSLRALRDGGVIDMAAASAPVLVSSAAPATEGATPGAIVVTAPVRRAPGREIGIGVAFGGERWSAAAPLVGTVAASVLFSLTTRVRLWVVAEYGQAEETRAPVSLRVRVPALALVPGLLLARRGRVTLLAGAGGGLALGHASTTLTEPMAQSTLNDVPARLIPFARVALRGQTRLTRRLALFASAGCDLLLSQPRYVVSWAGERVELLPAGRLRPALLAGLEGVFGAPAP